MTPIDKILQCVKSNQNFVLQGGAGSGKTETLSQVISSLSNEFPRMRIACITHTNKAADEIALRVNDDHTISTIHSFLSQLISPYRKNIHTVISKLFEIDTIESVDFNNFVDEKIAKKETHESYKKLHTKFTATYFTVNGIRLEKAVGKKIYDQNSIAINDDLNLKILALNKEIQENIEARDYQTIEYNETRFDNFNELSYGHDGVLKIATLLFKKYPRIEKILADKYNCIFIDEYQDTNENIVLTISEFANRKQASNWIFW